VKHIHKPITAKIRLLKTVEQTVELCRVIESTGVAAIAVHARYAQGEYSYVEFCNMEQSGLECLCNLQCMCFLLWFADHSCFRQISDRPNCPATWSFLRPIVESVRIPVILNGDVYCYDDIQRAKSETVNLNDNHQLLHCYI